MSQLNIVLLGCEYDDAILLRGLFFSGLRFFNDLEISDSIPRRTCAQDFPSTIAEFEPANLGSQGENVTPRTPRPTIIIIIIIIILIIIIIIIII